MHGLSSVDPGMNIDWGKTSLDYAKYRPGPPISFFQKLATLGVGLKNQKILDLGTGTGVLARQFSKQGCEVWASDISAEQIKMAETLTEMDQLKIQFMVAPAEESDFSVSGLNLNSSLDVITANQCFLYFDRAKVIPFIKKTLNPGGVLVTSHFSWLPLADPIAAASEKLILKYNPNWTAHSYNGNIPAIPYQLNSDFELKTSFYYDEAISFTQEEWRGRIRACRGIGAALDEITVARFDEEHAELLSKIADENFSVLHRIDAHIMVPI